MASQLIACPQCQAPLSLTPGRRFCQCTYCGSKFAIELPDSDSPRLARFESVFGAPTGRTMAPDAEQRLADLELTLADAEDDVECKQAELADRKAAYWRTRVNLQRLVAPMQNTTYVAGLLAAVAAFATLFVFKRPERLPGTLIAVLLAVTAWAFYREWQGAELQGQPDCEEARSDVKEAEGELKGALARVEDETLEREFLQRQVIASTSRRAASAP
jgi:uncharacterized coiled-coil protein SlyX